MPIGDVQKPEIEIRSAGANDDILLADMSAKTFFETYAPELDHAKLRKHISNTFSPEKQSTELSDSKWHFLLAETDGVPVGYIGLHEGKPPPEIKLVNAVCLARIYVLQEYTGHGIGTGLMQACLDLARRLNYQAIWLTAWERNARAIDFYNKWGFIQVGTIGYQFGDELQTDLLLWRMIDP